MKKWIAILLCAALFCLCGCTGPTQDPTDGPEDPPGTGGQQQEDFYSELVLSYWMGVPLGEYYVETQADGSKTLVWDEENGHYKVNFVYTDKQMTALYQDIVDAGFNLAFPECYNTSKEYNLKILKAAQSVGIRQVIQDGRVTNYLIHQDTMEQVAAGTLTEEEVVETVRGYLADYLEYDSFYALLILDEPGMEMMERVGFAKRIAEQVVPDKLFYTNLLPIYGYSPTVNDFDVYQEYLDAYFENVPNNPVACYDFYALRGSDDGLGNTIVRNWLRNIWALRTTIDENDAKYEGQHTDLWTFTQSVEHNQLRSLESTADATFQAYVNMSLGSTGILWFTYWAPNPGAENGYGNGLVDMTGAKTDVYGYVSEANHEILKLAPDFQKYRWTGVVTSPVRDSSGNLMALVDWECEKNTSRWLTSITSTRDAYAGIFTDANGNDAYMVVNFVEPSADYTDNTVTLTIKEHDQAYVYVNGEKTTMPIEDGVLTLQMEAGDGCFVIPA